MKILKQQYPEQYFATDEFGQSYATKTKYYLDHGIYRLEKWMKEHPDYVVYDTEKAFSITWQGEIFSGFIDRILYNQNTNSYIIEDIKTKDKPFKPDELATPLQFVIYVLALENVLDDPSAQISCYYDLPFCDQKQAAGTKGFMERGKNKLQQICYKIREKDFTPSPSPLCAWCNFSPTNPAQPEEGKGLCPYYSLWTSSNRVFTVANEWEGIENHPIVLAREAKKAELNKELNIDFDF